MVLGFVFVWLLWPFPFPRPRSLLGAKSPPQQSLIPSLHGHLTCENCVNFFGIFFFVYTNLFWSLTGPGVRDLWPSSNWKALLKALSVKKIAFYLFSDFEIIFELSFHCNFDANINTFNVKKLATHLKIETCLLILQIYCLWKLLDSPEQDPCLPSWSSC